MKIFLCALSFLIIVSCGAGRIPTWKQNAAADTVNFIESSFIGNESYASKYFEKMLEDFRMTVDPDEIVKAYLAKCAVSFAMLEYSDCAEVAEMLPLLKNKDNIAYYNFVSGRARRADEVPEKYREIFDISKNCDTGKANSALSSEKNPVTRLIKAASLTKMACGNAETAGIAVDTASKEGWKKAALKYLALQLTYFEKHGDRQNAELVKKRMELVVSEELPDK